MTASRPWGISILSFLSFVLGVSVFLGGIGVLGLISGIFGLLPLDTILRMHDLVQITPLHTVLQIWPKDIGAVTLLGMFFILGAIAYLMLSYGSLVGRRWAWTLGVLVGALNVVFALVMVSIGNFGVVSTLGLSPVNVASTWFFLWGVSTAIVVLYLTRGRSEIFFFEIER